MTHQTAQNEPQNVFNDAYLKTNRMTRQSRKHKENFSVAKSGTEIPKKNGPEKVLKLTYLKTISTVRR